MVSTRVDPWRRRQLILLVVCLATAATAGAATGSGSLRYSVLVEEFENKSEAPDTLGDEWATELTAALQQSGRFIVVAQADMQDSALGEQARGASGVTAQGRKTAARGRMTPAQLLVKGVITQVARGSANQGGGFGLPGLKITGGRVRSEIRATIQMIDATTSTVVAAKNFVGVAQGRNIGFSIDRGPGSLGGGGAADDNLHQAMAKAIEEVIPWMTAQLPTVAWRGSVVKVSSGRIIINRGLREGVSAGDEFVAGDSELLVDPDTGDTLDEIVHERARIRVVQVGERTATCSLVSGELRQILEGMGIQPGEAAAGP